MAYIGIKINFQYKFSLKDRPNLKMAAILKISKYFRQAHFEIIS